MVSDAVARHMDAVRELSKPGQALAPNAATATTKNTAWWIDGEPTLARERLHERLIAEVRARALDDEQQGRAIVLAGPPGAGKSTVLGEVLGGGPAEVSRQHVHLLVSVDPQYGIVSFLGCLSVIFTSPLLPFTLTNES